MWTTMVKACGKLERDGEKGRTVNRDLSMYSWVLLSYKLYLDT